MGDITSSPRLDRLERQAVTAVTPAPAVAVTPKSLAGMGCTAATAVTSTNRAGSVVGARVVSTEPDADRSASETLVAPVSGAKRVRCASCRHFVEMKYPRLGRCALDQPAPERGGLFWAADLRVCAAFEPRPHWPIGTRPDSRSRLHAWLREVAIETVVPLDELLAFYQDGLDALAAFSLDELRATVADYKAGRSEYRRLLERRAKSATGGTDEVVVDEWVATRAVA